MRGGFVAFDLAAKLAAVLLWRHAPWASLVCFFGPDLWLLHALLAPSSQVLVRVFTRFEPAGAEVFLTIDDGPDAADTPRLLDLLDRHRARAAFFLIGVRAAGQPGLVAEILRRGHVVAHHTHTHPTGTFWCASVGRVRAELDRATAVLRKAGAEPRWFRPPVGIKNVFLRRELAARGLACVGWNLRTRDCHGRDPARIAARALARVRPGDIILMHEGESVPPSVRVEAIARVLAGLEARGLRCIVPRQEQLR
jgi:peptidoglycan/xylan/chitin deacetylase (PgdA/CDA1 family)